MEKKTILITGGCGYIGSHTAIDLLQKGFEVISIDDLSRSKSFIPERIKFITGKPFVNYAADCRDHAAVTDIIKAHKNIGGIIHFAAYKEVNESVKNPLLYFDNNINGLINMLRTADEQEIPNFVFSSSCSVYGNATELPVTENTPLSEPESPYGRTKVMAEQIIKDFSAVSNMQFISLRYFNPAGAHASGAIGEVPWGQPANIVPSITQTAIGKRGALTVHGDDYNTRDGSCVRDYIHVMDIAEAHTRSLEYLLTKQNEQHYEIFNLGSGNGVTVLELIHAFEKVSGVKLNYTIGKRREGDVEAVYADNTKAKKYLHWNCTRDTDETMRSAWNWELQMQKENIGQV